MLHTELNSIQPQPQPHPQSQSPHKPTLTTQPTEPGPTIQMLTKEMENMIIENKLRKEAPLRSFWEAAVGRGWARERGRAVSMFGNGSAGGSGEGKPADVSAAGDLAAGIGFTMMTRMGMERNESPGRLPSPRPSPSPPPPGIVRRGSSYMRARSLGQGRLLICCCFKCVEVSVLYVHWGLLS